MDGFDLGHGKGNLVVKEFNSSFKPSKIVSNNLYVKNFPADKNV